LIIFVSTIIIVGFMNHKKNTGHGILIGNDRNGAYSLFPHSFVYPKPGYFLDETLYYGVG